MRYLWPLLLLLLSSCYYPYGPYYGYVGYPYSPYPHYGYGSGYYQGPSTSPPPYGYQEPLPGPQEPYAGNVQPGYSNPAANDPNNCGTPDEPQPCSGRYR
jgi:hypothetical protein